MNITDTCTLISETYSKSATGEFTAVENCREVLCTVGSINRAEFFEAGRSGLNPEIMLTVSWLDYEGEKLAEFHGERYAVYRSYRADDEKVELYLTKKAGA